MKLLSIKPLSVNPKNSQTHSKNLSAKTNKLFERDWPHLGLVLKELHINFLLADYSTVQRVVLKQKGDSIIVSFLEFL